MCISSKDLTFIRREAVLFFRFSSSHLGLKHWPLNFWISISDIVVFPQRVMCRSCVSPRRSDSLEPQLVFPASSLRQPLFTQHVAPPWTKWEIQDTDINSAEKRNDSNWPFTLSAAFPPLFPSLNFPHVTAAFASQTWTWINHRREGKNGPGC